MTVAGRTALITGGGSGLGAAIARALHAAGADVVLVGRQPEALQLLAAELGERAAWRVCDVADPGSVTMLADSLADVEISIVINNAGIAGPVAPLTEIDPKEWDEVFAIG